MVLHNKGIAGQTAHETWLSRLPDHRFEQIITANLYVSRSSRRSTSTEEDVLPGSLQKIIYDLKRASRDVATATIDRLAIRAGAAHGNAVEVAKEGSCAGDMSAARVNAP